MSNTEEMTDLELRSIELDATILELKQKHKLPNPNQRMINQMASDMVVLGPFADDDDAIRSLVDCHKYRPSEVMRLFEDAKCEAAQMVVAREMSDG